MVCKDVLAVIESAYPAEYALEWDNVGFEARIVQAMKDVPVRMISYGGSKKKITNLVKASDKTRALQALSDHLFNYKA